MQKAMRKWWLLRSRLGLTVKRCGRSALLRCLESLGRIRIKHTNPRAMMLGKWRQKIRQAKAAAKATPNLKLEQH